MNNVLIITGTCTGVVALFLLGAYSKYRKVDVKGILTKLEIFLKGAESYTISLEELSTGKVQKALNFTTLIEKAGETAIQYAAQLLISGQITDDADGTKRKAAALNYIFSFLEKEGIKVDDNVKVIATGIVESGVLSNKTIQQINEQLDKLIQDKVTVLQEEKNKIQSQLQQIQTEKAQLVTENSNLKAAIAQFNANTASTVKTTTAPAVTQ